MSETRDSLGDRMKANYELRQRFYLTRRTPVIVRLDGKAFHTFTRQCEKPFDYWFIDQMAYAAGKTAEEMQGFKLGYVASDEASFLLTDFDQLNTAAWFDYNKSKVESVSASMMTAWFGSRSSDTEEHLKGLGFFDARAFNIPLAEVANYFLWRAKDWERNSVSMLCQHHFSHKQLQGKGRAEQHELLHGIGVNWAKDIKPVERNGTFFMRGELPYRPGTTGIVNRDDVTPEWAQIDALVNEAMKPKEDATGSETGT